MTPTDSMEDPVEKLLFEALEVIDREGDRGLEALCRDHPARADALRRRLEALRDAGLAPGARADDSFPERLGEFHLLARLGQGGMGVVYRAKQLSLGREVALKLVRPDLLYFPGARERFRREVETIGGLQHPGIVPIHTVGEENGIPFYAMELVRGVTLADVIRAVAERAPSSLSGADFVRAVAPEVTSDDVSPLFIGSWVEVVLRVVREVAESLEHAHRRGVIHRDVKPSNIMVTAGGRVLLLDFGLASTAGVDRVTRTGSQLGTLPYMSPEQLDGVDDLDARTDVYSLGAVLYELLTLGTPHQAKTLGELLAAIRAGVAPGLSAANPAVSWDLDVVGRTALASERERRYGSAAAFARDVDNVLEHRPIEARRVGPLRRFRRWSQRHPSAAVAIVLALLAAVAGPIGWAVKAELSKRELQRAFQKEQAALEREREALVSSEASYETALDAVGYVLRTMAADDLRSSPTMQGLRLDSIDRALVVFADLERTRPNDERLRYERARLVASRGEVLGDLGRRPEGIEELERAIGALSDVVNAAGKYAAVSRHARAVARFTLGSVLASVGRHDDCRTAVEQAIEDLRDPAVARQDDARYELVAALDLLANHVDRRGSLDEAEPLLREALAIAEELVTVQPTNTTYVFRAGHTHGRLATTLAAQQRYDEAIGHAAIAVTRLELAHAAIPEDRVSKASLAQNLTTHGRLLGDIDRPDEGIDLLERGLVLRQELCADYPLIEGYATELISTRTQVAMTRLALGQTDGVLALFEANVRDAERMARDQPENPMFLYELAAQRHNLATFLIMDETDWERFEAIEAQALENARELLRDDPNGRSYRVLEHRTMHGIAIARCEASNPDEARRAVEACVALGELDVEGVVLLADAWARLWMCLDRHDLEDFERRERQAAARAAMYASLERARVLGFRQASLLRAKASFDPFRHEPEFQRLIDLLE